MFKSIKTKKTTAWLLTLAMLFSLITPGLSAKVKADDLPKVFDLVEITDFHGALEDSSTPPLPAAGVLAKDIKDIKNANPNRTLVIGGGDLYQGTPISNVLFGVPVQKALSNIGMEVTALGNHEFDWTLDKIIQTTMDGANYSIVCANLYKKDGNTRVFQPYKIITKDGVKIAVVGAITTETPTIALPANVANYNFTDPVQEINSVVKSIRDNKEADVVVAVIHEGSNQDTKTGPIFDIANKLQGVDAVMGGHSHTIVQATAADGKTPVVIAKAQGKGYIDLKMSIDSTGKVSFTNPTSSYVAIDTNSANGYRATTPVTDPEVMKIIADAKLSIGKTFDEVIGNTTTKLDRVQKDKPYGESFLGNWTADVIKATAGADVGFQNNGGIRIDIPAGDITVGTIFTLMPFDNEICTVDMTKAQIKAVLEQAFADGGKGIQLSGIKVTYDSTKDSGNRVTNITRADGTVINDTEKLKVATNDFMAGGGDGFTAFVDAGAAVKGIPTNDTHTLIRDALIKSVRDNKGVVASIDKRIANVATTTNVAKTISIVATSDVHGNILPIDYSTGAVANQGLAKVSTYVNSVRNTNPNVMLVDVGDTIQGTPLSYYYDKIDTKTEYPMMKVMGAMKYDAWTLGNHEFNYGLDVLNRVIGDANKEQINVLSANTYKTSDNTNFVKPYIVKTMNVNGKDIKIGVLGLTTKCIPNWENTSNYAGLQFNDLVDEAKKWVPILKATEKVDILVATIHSGEEGANDTIPENQVKAVAGAVSGIDAIVCGHAHSKINSDISVKNPDGKVVPITEPGKWAQYVSQVDITVNPDATLGAVTTKVVPMDSNIAADSNIVTLAQPYQESTVKYINTVIGNSTGEFTGANQTTKETALMDLINKVQMSGAGTQLSIAAPLSATAYIPSGDVKIKDLMGVYVFENFLYGVKMTGAQLKNWMEYSVRYYKQTNNPSDVVAKDDKLNIPDYNLDQLYGVKYDIDLTQPACTVDPNTGIVNSGNRIKNMTFKGLPVKDTDVFTVAINNYRYNGGGGFIKAAGLTMKDSSGKDVIKPDITTYDSMKTLGDDGQVRNMMIKYIQDNKTITPTISNYWNASVTSLAITNITKQTSFTAGNDADIRVQVTNNGTEAQNATLIVALYQGNKFISYVKCAQSIDAGKSVILNGGFTIPKGSNYRIKCMVWDDLDSGKPLSSAIEIPVADN